MFPAESEVMLTLHHAEQQARETTRHRQAQIEKALQQEGIAEGRRLRLRTQFNGAWTTLRRRFFGANVPATCAS